MVQYWDGLAWIRVPTDPGCIWMSDGSRRLLVGLKAVRSGSCTNYAKWKTDYVTVNTNQMPR